MLDVTSLVARRVAEHHIETGMVVVFVPHTTAGITINENADPDVQHDLLKKLETLVPQRESFYQHDEGNSDSHIKASLMGSSVCVLIEKGELVLCWFSRNWRTSARALSTPAVMRCVF